MAALTEAEMLEVVSDLYGDSDDDLGGGPIVAPTEQLVLPLLQLRVVNLVRLQDGIPIYLWRRSMSFLTVREQAVSVRSMSRFFRKCSDVYMCTWRISGVNQLFACHRVLVVLRERWRCANV